MSGYFPEAVAFCAVQLTPLSARSGHYRNAAISGSSAPGRIEARTGLRMMPTFPRPSLSFHMAGLLHTVGSLTGHFDFGRFDLGRFDCLAGSPDLPASRRPPRDRMATGRTASH